MRARNDKFVSRSTPLLIHASALSTPFVSSAQLQAPRPSVRDRALLHNMLRLAPRCISNHRRHLATVASNHATEFKMPLIDFSRFLRGDDKDQAAVARELLEGFTTSGFVYLGGDHGISSTLRQKTFAESAKFFAMPRDVKESLAWLTAQENRGYLVPGRERVSRLQTKAEVDAASE